jgi:hypothetical protein
LYIASKVSPKSTTIHDGTILGDDSSSSRKKRKNTNIDGIHDCGRKKKGGWKLGGKNWSAAAINLLLHVVEEELPCGRDMWDNVAALCSKMWDGEDHWARPDDSCKKKFEKLAFMKAPTGAAGVPAEVRKAKQLLLKIEEKEGTGIVELNESDDLSCVLDGKKHEVALKGIRLLFDNATVDSRLWKREEKTV